MEEPTSPLSVYLAAAIDGSKSHESVYTLGVDYLVSAAFALEVPISVYQPYLAHKLINGYPAMFRKQIKYVNQCALGFADVFALLYVSGVESWGTAVELMDCKTRRIPVIFIDIDKMLDNRALDDMNYPTYLFDLLISTGAHIAFNEDSLQQAIQRVGNQKRDKQLYVEE